MLPPFESSFTVGTKRTEWQEPSGRLGITICKDMDFPHLSRQYGNDGVGLVLVPAWDFNMDGVAAWPHGDPARGGERLQHSSLAKDGRPVDNRRSRTCAGRAANEFRALRNPGRNRSGASRFDPLCALRKLVCVAEYRGTAGADWNCHLDRQSAEELSEKFARMVSAAGIEPATHALKVRCSTN